MNSLNPSHPDSDYLALRMTLRGHTKELISLAWSPDGTCLASGAGDGTFRIWDASNGGLLYTSTERMGWGINIQWSPDRSRLLTWASDWGIRLWNTRTWKRISDLATGWGPHRDYIGPVDLSPDGVRITSRSVEGTVCLWNAISGRLISVLGNNMPPIFWFPDGRRLATSHTEDPEVIRDPSNGQNVRVLQRTQGAWGMVWSPDGTYIASCFRDEDVRVWESESGTLVHTLRGHQGYVCALAWSPDGKHLASGSVDQNIFIWDASSAQSVQVLSGHRQEVFSLAWSPDGHWLASGTRSHGGKTTPLTEMRIWDTANWQPLAAFSEQARQAQITWHPTLPWLVTAGAEVGDVYVWEVVKGEASG